MKRDIIDNTDAEVVLRFGFLQLVEDAFDHRRRELFRRQSVSPADDARHRVESGGAVHRAFGDRCDYVLIQRLAGAARLFCSIENRDL